MKVRRKKEWFDDEAFWMALFPFIFSERQFADAADQADKLLKLTNPQGKKVLDLCCGPGRFSIPLAAKGFIVTGVDRTAFLLEKARVRAKAAQVGIEWVQKDMRDFIRPEAFDVVISMYSSFGYFDNSQHDLDVLHKHFHEPQAGWDLSRRSLRKRARRESVSGDGVRIVRGRCRACQAPRDI